MRLSQTFLAHADRCLRSARLYGEVGSTPSHPKARGTAFHMAAERMLRNLIERGEQTLYAAGHTQDPKTGEAIPEDEDHAKRHVASLTEAVVTEVRAENPDLLCTHDDWDKVRLMAFHWAVASPVDPTRVVAVERKFVLDVGPCTVVGKIDVASMTGQHAEVLDYKTSLAQPSQEEFEASFQHKLYSLLVCFGQPVSKVPCKPCKGTGYIGETGTSVNPYSGVRGYDPQQGGPEECPACGGPGYTEKRHGPIGEHIGWVKAREVYPRYLLEDGSLFERERTLTRTELTDFRVDLEALIARVVAASEADVWPAVPGSHCHICPAPAECPLAEEFIGPRGSQEGIPFRVPVITAENAEDEAERWYFLTEQATALRKALRGYAKEHDASVRIGRDLVLEFRQRDRTEMDWDRYEAACVEADRLGHPRPPVDEYRRSKSSTPFEKRRLRPEEIQGKEAA